MGRSYSIPGIRVPKYRNLKTEVDGITFDSKREADRYGELKLLLQVGAIKDLKLQVWIPITVNGVRICAYVADFVYTEVKTGERRIEDAKGFRTKEYKLKKKLLKACGITITEV